MARPSRSSRVAPASAKQAGTAVAPSNRSIDTFGRVSKRVAPSSLIKAPAATPTVTIPARRQAAVEQFLADKAITVELPSAAEAAAQPRTKTPKTAKKTAPASSSAPVSSSTKQRKRRAAEALDSDSSSSTTSFSSPSSSQQQPSAAKRARRTTKATTCVADLLTRTAQKKADIVLPSVDSDSDSASTPASSLDSGSLIACLNRNFSSSLSTSFPLSPRSTSSSPRPNSTAPTTPCEPENESEDAARNCKTTVLPLELLDLLRLQNAFAKTLALHHAHHGTNAPVDLRTFCPGVAQAWGKRSVALEDVQRCLGVVSLAAAADNKVADALFLADYGRGKICIEMQNDIDIGPMGTLADRLNAVFEANLRARWAASASSKTATDLKQFIAALPKAPVTASKSVLQTAVLRAKGQCTLEELMHGIALKKQEKAAHEAMLKAPVAAAVVEAESMDVDSDKTATTTSAREDTVTAATAATPMNLLDRIRFRQMQRAQLQAAGALAAPPTPEELERRAALQRVGDIAEVLSMLCTAASLRQSNRVSFGMTAITSKIKDSLRMPIAREEAASCVRLLAKEVAPQWLSIVSMGGREIVIMLADVVPSKTMIQERVQSLTR
ncbi:uncharacterized protein SPSK_04136 [Sporothrix schenckii 1099-18]|uniref:DNA replication factor Cdt1 C-terminal domain-containing protein n=1 Tax=Sporothrix schenckii 1099-18 TaxID=1397361 RepID=A0A0F2M0H8_SPOSC|nr:uncharacterized protein SPSK_04136 [Sporothrix schenckii 1099-18]KJR83218.1 hypothetical protein SPSK_04136 [Sporothrix schenckii 1099-18]